MAKRTPKSGGKPPRPQPNILIIWGDDIGITNLSCYSHGVMGYQTPNIDRLAKEGMMSPTRMASSPVPRGVPRS